MEASQFEGVYQEFCPSITGYLFHQTHDAGLAEDMAGDVFERAYRAWPRFDGEHTKRWLYRIAVNVLIDQQRRAGILHFQALDAPLVYGGHTDVEQGSRRRVNVIRYTAREDVEAEAMTNEALAEWATALDSLPAHYRAALLLRQNGQSCQQIADRLGTTYYAVKALLFRARHCLRAALPEDWDRAA